MSRKKHFGLLIKIVISLFLIYWVLKNAGLTSVKNTKDYLFSLTEANLLYLILAIAIIPVTDMVSTNKWYFLSKAKNLNSPFLRLFRFYIIGRFFNLVLPSNIGGDVIRIHLQGKDHGNISDAAAAVAMERATGLITLLGYTAIAMLFISKKFVSNGIIWLFIAFSAALAFCILVLSLENSFSLIHTSLKKIFPIFQKQLEKLRIFRESIVSLSKNKKAMLIAFANSVIFHFVAVINAWVSIRVFDNEVPLLTMVIAVPIIMFLMNIPMSIGNIGIMEFAYTATISTMGFTPSLGLSLALFMRLKTLISAGFGALLYYTLSEKKDKNLLRQFHNLENSKQNTL